MVWMLKKCRDVPIIKCSNCEFQQIIWEFFWGCWSEDKLKIAPHGFPQGLGPPSSQLVNRYYQSHEVLNQLEERRWLAGWLGGWVVGWLAGWWVGWLVGLLVRRRQLQAEEGVGFEKLSKARCSRCRFPTEQRKEQSLQNPTFASKFQEMKNTDKNWWR